MGGYRIGQPWTVGNRTLVARTCVDCLLLLPASAFRQTKGMWTQRCVKCHRKKYAPKPWQQHKFPSEQAYTDLLEAQGFQCAIASCDKYPTDIDHDHSCCPGSYSCGKCIRGLLCRKCNTHLHPLEDPKRLAELLDYLRRTREAA